MDRLASQMGSMRLLSEEDIVWFLALYLVLLLAFYCLAIFLHGRGLFFSEKGAIIFGMGMLALTTAFLPYFGIPMYMIRSGEYADPDKTFQAGMIMFVAFMIISFFIEFSCRRKIR